jgi:MFS family permease
MSQQAVIALEPEPLRARFILAMVLGQMGVHASMAGFRMAAPLQALGEGASTGAVGLILALFAVAPIGLAFYAGRLADRHGFHRPMAVAMVLAMAGAALAVASTALTGWAHVAALGLGALVSGAGANFGVLAVQRTAGLRARNPAERVRLFSWLGIAPSLANVVGPVAAGFVIDIAGFRAAFGLLMLLPLATWWAMRQIPREGQPQTPVGPSQRSAFSLLQEPGMRRLLLVNWLLAICWDVHSFAVPIMGHGLGFSASTIGLVLGMFTLSVSAVRLLIPALAHALALRTVIVACMLGTAAIYMVYPLASLPWHMLVLAGLLGITLGSAQPMIMTALHQLTPDGRHGESLALRSVAINLSSAMMPIAFGALGVVVGAGALFWLVGVTVGAGARVAQGLRTGPT